MGVFEPSAFLCEAARAAGRELKPPGWAWPAADRGGATASELAAALGVPDGHRLRALLEVLVALGELERRGEWFCAAGGGTGADPGETGGAVTEEPAEEPAAPVVRAGWGLLADVIRSDRPLAIDPAHEGRYHAHLLEAGAPAARELARLLGELRELGALGAGASLLDLGGGAGAYTAAFLDAHPAARATLVDAPATVALAAAHLARFGDRVRFVEGDARTAAIGEGHGAALLANVLHLHPPEICAELCAAAARAVAPGGLVAVVDLRVDEGRAGPIEGLLFALGMAIYTDGGSVYEASRIRGWIAAAGLVALEEHRLAAAPEVVVVIARRPAVAEELDAALAANASEAWQILARDGLLLDTAHAAGPPALALAPLLRATLARAIADERAAGDAASLDRAAALVRHYTELMPRARIAQLAGRGEPGASFFHHRLDWARLPRLASAIDRLYALLADAGAPAAPALGAETAESFRTASPTLAALYERTHYGRSMPLLYGSAADLAHFRARADAGGLSLDAAIDRYLTAPIVHELCHFAPGRAALAPQHLFPLHLDECLAGWLGVHVHPELAYPAPGNDDAIFAAPWLSQVGQAIARAFGVRAVVRAQAGAAPWAAALPAAFVDAAARLGWADWRARRTLHFLSDTLDPAPWVRLALAAGAGRDLTGETLASLARLPPDALAGLPDDPAFDAAIVEDGLRAMCLDSACVDGSFRTWARTPGLTAAPIILDATTGWIAGPTLGAEGVTGSVTPSVSIGLPAQTPAAPVRTRLGRTLGYGAPPRYWLPPAVCARLTAAGLAGYELRLADLDAIPAAAAAICAAAPGTPPSPPGPREDEPTGYHLASRTLGDPWRASSS